MQHELKQRLVGVVVITSLAAIFIPMLFDDPIDESGKKISELTIPNASYTQLETNRKNKSKTIEEIVNLPDPSPVKQQNRNSETIFNRWFLQVGIFGQKENALALQDKLRKQGFPVTMLSVSTEEGERYKVRVGPELDKKTAEEMKVRIDKLNNINSLILDK